MTRVLGVLHRLCCRDEPGGSDAVTTPSGFSDQFRRILQLKKDDDLEQWRERRDDRGLYSVHGTPRLRRSVVTYLDTLGTKARSANLSDADLRGDIEDNDEYQKRLHSRFWNGATQRMVTFSDNVCVAAPIDGQDVEALIRDQVDAAASFQIARVLGGRAIRGGITIGEVYCDSNYVDGPALVEAVSLEEKVAKDPRVLIDGHAAAEIRNRWAGHAEPWPYRLVAVDDDDRLFLNYLHVRAVRRLSVRSNGPDGEACCQSPISRRQRAGEGPSDQGPKQVAVGRPLSQLVRRGVLPESSRPAGTPVQGARLLAPVVHCWVNRRGAAASNTSTRRRAHQSSVAAVTVALRSPRTPT